MMLTGDPAAAAGPAGGLSATDEILGRAPIRVPRPRPPGPRPGPPPPQPAGSARPRRGDDEDDRPIAPKRGAPGATAKRRLRVAPTSSEGSRSSSGSTGSSSDENSSASGSSDGSASDSGSGSSSDSSSGSSSGSSSDSSSSVSSDAPLRRRSPAARGGRARPAAPAGGPPRAKAGPAAARARAAKGAIPPARRTAVKKAAPPSPAPRGRKPPAVKTKRRSGRSSTESGTASSGNSSGGDDDEGSSGSSSDVSSSESSSGGGSGGDLDRRIAASKRFRDVKDKLIAQLLSRWWYVLPPWPPADFDAEAALARLKFRRVALNEWEAADDVDESGFTKVYQVSHFPGVFRTPDARTIDVRPTEGKPCFSEFAKLSQRQLASLLAEALQKQLAELDKSPFMETDGPYIERIRNSLTAELRFANDLIAKIEKKQPP